MIMSALTDWGLGRRTYGYLQVEGDNDPALAFIRNGFALL